MEVVSFSSVGIDGRDRGCGAGTEEIGFCCGGYVVVGLFLEGVSCIFSAILSLF